MVPVVVAVVVVLDETGTGSVLMGCTPVVVVLVPVVVPVVVVVLVPVVEPVVVVVVCELIVPGGC